MLPLLALAAGVAALPRAHAEELALLAGATAPDGHWSGVYYPSEQSSVTYGWELEYRQRILQYLDASFAYLNEGHLLGHQRDGGVAQLWAVSPRWRDRLGFAFGVGPYLYFDTQQTDQPPWFRNYHGVGEIYTGSLTYYAANGWFARLSLSEIHAPGNVDTHMLLLGAGYRLDQLFHQQTASEREQLDTPSRHQLGVFGGETVENGLGSSKSASFGIEYRYRVTSHVELSGAWLNEDDGLDGRHNGVLGALWLENRLFSPRLSVGIGIGPYVSLQEHRGEDGELAPSVVGMGAMTMSWQLARSLLGRLTWYRGFTQDDQDRDVIIMGLSWDWGR